jgi:hypothetical protein
MPVSPVAPAFGPVVDGDDVAPARVMGAQRGGKWPPYPPLLISDVVLVVVVVVVVGVVAVGGGRAFALPAVPCADEVAASGGGSTPVLPLAPLGPYRPPGLFHLSVHFCRSVDLGTSANLALLSPFIPL